MKVLTAAEIGLSLQLIGRLVRRDGDHRSDPLRLPPVVRLALRNSAHITLRHFRLHAIPSQSPG